MTRAAAPDRRRAFAVPDKPLPTFRVRSASGEPSHLVVVQRDLSLSCNCTAASFGARSCSHRRIVTRSIERRTGYPMPELESWAASAAEPAGILGVLQGGRP